MGQELPRIYHGYLEGVIVNRQIKQLHRTFSGLLVDAIIIIRIMVFLDPVLTSLDSTETILPYARAHAKICIENKSYLIH